MDTVVLCICLTKTEQFNGYFWLLYDSQRKYVMTGATDLVPTPENRHWASEFFFWTITPPRKVNIINPLIICNF